MLALAGEETEDEEEPEKGYSLTHFLHSACRLGFPNVEVGEGGPYMSHSQVTATEDQEQR